MTSKSVGVIAMLVAGAAAFGLTNPSCIAARTLAFEKMDMVAKYGFYTDFRPLSYANTQDECDPRHQIPLGYEPALMKAVSNFTGGLLEVEFKPIPNPFSGIWLKAANNDYDMIGGGIGIKESRMLDAGGQETIRFGTGHVAFHQSLLVRSDSQVQVHGDLGREDTVAALPGTTGEARLYQLLGLTDDDGVLISGVTVELQDGSSLISDGSDSFVVTGDARTSAILSNRAALRPPGDLPTVLLKCSEKSQLDALLAGEVQAVGRGELGNIEAAASSKGHFKVTALDAKAELGGFAYPATSAGDRTRAVINTIINCLTDDRRLGFRDYRADPNVFMARALHFGVHAHVVIVTHVVGQLPAAFSG